MTVLPGTGGVVPAPEQASIFQAGRRSREELRALGRSLREEAARRDHGAWRPEPDRPDPLDVLRGQEADRLEELIPIRYGRMRASPFNFYRGAAAVMAWDLSRTPTTGVNVQACGDAHCYNLGLYASPERRAVFDINDFDETLPGPWEWDLKRLAVSVLLDACAHGHSEETGLDLLRITLRRYCDELEELSHATSLDIHYAHVESDELIARTDDPRVADEMRARVAKARRRTNHQAFRKWAHVVDGELRFVEEPPLLVRLPDEMIERFHALLNRYRSTLQPNRRHLLEQYRFRDAARKVVGVGSVGLRAYVVLLEGRGETDPLVIQIKEAVSSVLTPYLGRSGCARHGERVVVGQRIMQAVSDPFLGWAPFAERDFYVRQLRDMKGSTGLASDRPVLEAHYALCGGTLARAHARSVDPALLSGYLGSGDPFVESVVTFGRAYAEQNARDHERLERAVREGEVPAIDA